MMSGTEALAYVLYALGGFWVMLALTRALLLWAGVSFQQPLAQFCLALTNWAVLPLRKLLPAWRRLDSASVVLAWSVALLIQTLVSWLQLGSPAPHGAALLAGLALSLVFLAHQLIHLYVLILIVGAVLSWVAPYHPLQSMFTRLSSPLLWPVQKVLPRLGGVDLSPLVVLLLLQVLERWPLALLELRLGLMWKLGV